MDPTISKLTLYYDSDVDNPKESIATLRELLTDIAANGEITVEEQDTAAFSEADREELFEEMTALVHGRPYSVGNRVFTPTLFGSRRPVLLIDYAAEDQPPDIYPHRNDDVSTLPISVKQVLEDLSGEGTSEESDFKTVHSSSSPDSENDSGTEQVNAESPSTDSRSIVDQLRAIIT